MRNLISTAVANSAERWGIDPLRPRYRETFRDRDKPRLFPWYVRATAARFEAASRAQCETLGAPYRPPEDREGTWYKKNNHRHIPCGNLARAERGNVDFLYLSVSGRFGNNVLQILNAATLARTLGIARIYHAFGWLPPRSKEVDGVTLIRGRPKLGGDSAGVWSTFFYGRNNKVLESLSPEAFLQTIDTMITPSSRFQFAPDPKPSITAHIRGGDIMTGTNPHPLYVQPPLAFYTRAIRDIANTTGLSRVVIVAEDRLNPVADALEHWARREGFEVDATPGSLAEDQRRLFVAENLVLSESSFAATLALLSPYTKRTYAFRNTDFETKLLAKIPEFFRASDTTDTYIRVGEWKNTDAQRALMIDLPESAISIERIARNGG